MENDLKQYLDAIDAREGKLCDLSDEIWGHPETAFTEFQSEEALIRFFESEGFTITRQAYGVDTAFTAAFGSGRPRVGFLGEFDALSGLSQEADIVEKKALTPGACGHGCGHNLLGTGAAAAAVAVKKYLEAGHPGTVVYYGCPGEEGGSGKAFMARGGAFRDLDCALTWHPGTYHEVVKDSSLANFQFLYSFHGISAHAAGCPEMGRSALDALELMNVGVNFLREHMIDDARVHYAITDTGGYSPNVVQDQAKAIYLIRAPKVGQADALVKRVHKIAAGAALMTETTEEHELIKSCANVVPNVVLEKVLYESMLEVGVPAYTEEEYAAAAAYTATVPGPSDPTLEKRAADRLIPANAKELRSFAERRIYDSVVPYEEIHRVTPEGGSTDVGDVSWMCPTSQIHTATWAPRTPGHSWQAVAQGKSSLAHKGMLYAGKCLALAAMKLMEDPDRLREARAEYEEALQGQSYIPIPDGVKPRPISQIG